MERVTFGLSVISTTGVIVLWLAFGRYKSRLLALEHAFLRDPGPATNGPVERFAGGRPSLVLVSDDRCIAATNA